MKVLIVGFGSIGQRHAEVLSSIETVNEIHVVSKQKKLGFLTFRSLIEVPDIKYYDYFVIASITSLHLTQLKFIDENVSDKIILVEKPLTVKVVDICVRNKVFVAYNLRFHPIMKTLNGILENEVVLSINIQTGQYLPTWRPGSNYSDSYSASVEKGGGVLLDLSHEIDYLLWLLGEIKSIRSINCKISDLNIDSDDFVTAIGRMESGAIFNFSMDYLAKIPMRRIVINTVNKTIEADFIKSRLCYSDKSYLETEISFSHVDRNISYIEMHKQILGLDTENNVATLDDGLKVLSIIDKIRISTNERD